MFGCFDVVCSENNDVVELLFSLLLFDVEKDFDTDDDNNNDKSFSIEFAWDNETVITLLVSIVPVVEVSSFLKFFLMVSCNCVVTTSPSGPVFPITSSWSFKNVLVNVTPKQKIKPKRKNEAQNESMDHDYHHPKTDYKLMSKLFTAGFSIAVVDEVSIHV